MRKLPEVSNTNGAQCGMGDTINMDVPNPTLHCRRMKWVDGDYLENGAYFGHIKGDHIFWFYDDENSIFIRAKNHDDAKEQITGEYFPDAKFIDDQPALDEFTMAYIIAALWSSTEYKFGECPCCGKVALLDKYPEEEFREDAMCSAEGCGTREIANPDPMDDNYTIDDIAPETMQKMVDDCAKFQAENDLTDYPANRAGNDFWLTRCGHGCGFWENDYGTEEQCEKLTEASKVFGNVDLYVGDDGKIYGS